MASTVTSIWTSKLEVTYAQGIQRIRHARKAAQDAGAATINIGLFINALISFLIVAFALFVVVKLINQLTRQQEQEPEEPPAPPREVQLLEEIRDALVKGAKG